MLGTREYTLCSPFRANAHNSSLCYICTMPLTAHVICITQYHEFITMNKEIRADNILQCVSTV